MNKDFVKVANDSGSNNGSFDVVCGQNSGDERSTILTVSGGGVSKTVAVKQASDSYKNKTFVIALGNNLIECICISDAKASGTRTILLQANNIALADDAIKEYFLDTSTFFVGIQSVDGDTSAASKFISMRNIRIDNYFASLTKTGVIGFECLYFAGDRGNLVYNLANVIAYPSKSINITGADFNLNIVFTDTTMEYWCLSGALFMNKRKGTSGDLALITYSNTIEEEHKLVFWRGVNTVNSGDGVQIVGYDIIPIAKTVQHPHNCKEYILNDAVDYISLYQFALQVLQYPDSPIPMSLNTTTDNKQFEFELHLYK